MTEEEEKKECGSMLIERFNLYLHHGFTVVSIAVNDEIGRVCVLRKSDFKRTYVFFLEYLFIFYTWHLSKSVQFFL